MARAQANATTVWTTRKLLAWMGDAFARAGLESPRLCAEMLLAHVIGCEKLKLYTEPDRPASPIERQMLRELTARALKDEPVQYLIEQAWFFGMAFFVDKRVLIPRPSSATIVEEVLQHARVTPGFGAGEDQAFGQGVLIADICTGSGCIGIALAKHMPAAHVLLTDISSDALEVARINATCHSVDQRVDVLQGDMFDALATHPVASQHGSLHYIVANPPYIPDDEWEATDPRSGVQANVKAYEPELALRGGVDGLKYVRPLLEQGAAYLKSGGMILIEVAASRAEEARKIAQHIESYESVRVLKDYEGLARTIVAQKAR